MTWWQRVLRRGRMEELLERELRFHLDAHTADLVARGVPPEEAGRLARLALGGPEQVKERCRDARGTRWLDDLWQDVRYALRDLRRRPAFAAVALLTLALGSGATTVMFTVINGVLFAPLPFADPGSLLNVEEETKGIVDYRWGDRWAFSYPNFLDLHREIRSLLADPARPEPPHPVASAFVEEYFAHVPAAWRKRFRYQCAGAFIEVAAGVFRAHEPGWPERAADAIYRGLVMGVEEKRRRNEGARDVVRTNDISRWISRQVQDIRDLVGTPGMRARMSS